MDVNPLASPENTCQYLGTSISKNPSNTKNIKFSIAFKKINKHEQYDNMTPDEKKNQSIEVELGLTQMIEF